MADQRGQTGYQRANGIAHSMTPNARGLPETLQDAGVLKDKYSYDANGNVTAIADQQESVFGRTMTYDDLDRLSSASAPNVWGSASYKYDPVDNLRVANVGTRNTTISVNANTNVETGAAQRLTEATLRGITSSGMQMVGKPCRRTMRKSARIAMPRFIARSLNER